MTLVAAKADFLSQLNCIPAINGMARKLDENHAIASQKRLNASISFSAEKRFADFANSYPEFLRRFPQRIIASYLGITKETLSRIRHQLVNK
jgi:CRP-like cAMP-binding protein